MSRDVIVIGGGASGIAAALAALERGCAVTLIELVAEGLRLWVESQRWSVDGSTGTLYEEILYPHRSLGQHRT